MADTRIVLALLATLTLAGAAGAGGLVSMGSIKKEREARSKARIIDQLQRQQRDEAPNAPADEPAPAPDVTTTEDYQGAPPQGQTLQNQRSVLRRPSPAPVSGLSRSSTTPAPGPARAAEIPLFIPYGSLADVDRPSATALVPLAALGQLRAPAPAAARPDAPPPVGRLLGQASYELSLEPGRTPVARLRSTLAVEVLQKGYVVLPLPADPEVTLESLLVDGQPAVVQPAELDQAFTDRRAVKLVLVGPGTHTLAFTAARAVEGRAEEGSAAFALPRTPIARLTVSLPGQDLAVEVSPSAGLTRQAAGGRTTAACQLPPTDRVQVRWWRETGRRPALARDQPLVGDEPAPAAAAPQRKQPVVSATAYGGVTFADGILTLRARLRYEISQAPVDALRAVIPADLELLQVTGPDGKPLRSYRYEPLRLPGGGAARVLTVYLAQERDGTVDLSLLAQADRSSLLTGEGSSRQGRLVVPLARPEGVQSSTCFLSLRLGGTLSPNYQDGPEFTAVTEGDLPDWVPDDERKNVGASWKALVSAPAAGPVVELQEEAGQYTDAFQILEARVETVLTAEKASQTKVWYRLRNTNKQFLEVTLPKGSTFQSLYVADAPAKAGLKEGCDRTLLVPLVKSPTDGARKPLPIAVELVYATTIEPLARAGALRLEGPGTGEMVDRAWWRVRWPEDLTFLRRAGSLDRRPRGYEGAIADQTVQAQGGGQYGRANDMSNVSMPSQALSQSAPGRAALDSLRRVGSLKAGFAAAKGVEGAYPVRLDLPPIRSGEWFFAENLKPGADLPWLRLAYVKAEYFDKARSIIVVVTAFSLLLLLVRLAGRKPLKVPLACLTASIAAALLFHGLLVDCSGHLLRGFTLGLAMAALWAAFWPVRWWLRPAAPRPAMAPAPVTVTLCATAALLAGGPAWSAPPAPPAAPAAGAARTLSVVVPYEKDGLGAALQRYRDGGLVPTAVVEEARRPAPEPSPAPSSPAESTLRSLAVSGTVPERGPASLEVTCRFATFGPGYKLVPLLRVFGAVHSATLDGQPAPLTVREDQAFNDTVTRQNDIIVQALESEAERIGRVESPVAFTVPVAGAGEHALTLVLTADVKDLANKWKGLELGLPDYQQRSLSLALAGADLKVEAPEAAPLTVRAEGGRTLVEAQLKGVSKVAVRWFRRAQAEAPSPTPTAAEGRTGAAPAAAPTPPAAREPLVVARLCTSTTLDETLLRGSVVVDYQIEREGIEAVRLDIPAGLTIKTLHGQSHKDFQVVDGDQAGRKTLVIMLKRAARGNLLTGFDFERPLDAGAATTAPADATKGREVLVELPQVRSLDTELESGVVGVERTGNLEVAPAREPVGLEKIDAARAPEAFRPLLADKASLVYRYRRQPWGLAVTVQEHPAEVGYTASIDQATFGTTLNRRGQGQTEVQLQIRNYGQDFLNVELAPGMGEVKSLVIEGEEKNFLKVTKERMIRIPLRKPTKDKDYAEQAQLVTFRFEHNAVAPSGDPTPLAVEDVTGRQLRLFLPRFNLPVTGRGLSWSLGLPDDCQVGSFQGAFREDRRAPTSLEHLFRYARGPRLGLRCAFVLGQPRGFGEPGGSEQKLVLRVAAPWEVGGLQVVAGCLAAFSAAMGLLLVVGAGRPWYSPTWGPGAVLCGVLLLALEARNPGNAGPVELGLLLAPVLAVAWAVKARLRLAPTAAAAALLLTLATAPAAAQAQAPAPVTVEPSFVFVRDGALPRLLGDLGDRTTVRGPALQTLVQALEGRTAPNAQATEPPVALTVGSGSYQGSVTGDAASFTATLEVWLFADGPLPLSPFPGEVAAVSATVDGKPVNLQLSGPDGAARRPWLELRGKGLHRVQLRFLAPVSRFGDVASLSLEIPRAPLGSLELTLDEPEADADVVPSTGFSAAAAGPGKTVVRAGLPYGGTVFVRWSRRTAPAPAVAEPQAGAAAQPEPLLLDGQVALTATVRLGQVELEARHAYAVKRGVLQALRLALPPGLDLLQAEGANLQRWSVDRGPAGDVLVVQLESRFDRAYELRWRGVMARPAEQPGADATVVSTIALAGAATEGAATEKGFVVVRVDDDVEPVPGLVLAATRVDPSEAARAGGTPGDALLAYKFIEPGWTLPLGLVRRPRVERTSLRVDGCEAVALVTEDRALLVQQTWSVVNDGAQFLSVTLPGEGALTSCFVDGKARAAGRGAAPGEILVPLVRSAGAPGALTPVSVEVSFVAPLDGRLGAVAGRLRLPLARVAHAVRSLSCRVLLPDGVGLAPGAGTMRWLGRSALEAWLDQFKEAAGGLACACATCMSGPCLFSGARSSRGPGSFRRERSYAQEEMAAPCAAPAPQVQMMEARKSLAPRQAQARKAQEEAELCADGLADSFDEGGLAGQDKDRLDSGGGGAAPAEAKTSFFGTGGKGKAEDAERRAFVTAMLQGAGRKGNLPVRQNVGRDHPGGGHTFLQELAGPVDPAPVVAFAYVRRPVLLVLDLLVLVLASGLWLLLLGSVREPSRALAAAAGLVSVAVVGGSVMSWCPAADALDYVLWGVPCALCLHGARWLGGWVVERVRP